MRKKRPQPVLEKKDYVHKGYVFCPFCTDNAELVEEFSFKTKEYHLSFLDGKEPDTTEEQIDFLSNIFSEESVRLVDEITSLEKNTRQKIKDLIRCETCGFQIDNSRKDMVLRTGLMSFLKAYLSEKGYPEGKSSNSYCATGFIRMRDLTIVKGVLTFVAHQFSPKKVSLKGILSLFDNVNERNYILSKLRFHEASLQEYYKEIFKSTWVSSIS